MVRSCFSHFNWEIISYKCQVISLFMWRVGVELHEQYMVVMVQVVTSPNSLAAMSKLLVNGGDSMCR